LARVRDGAGDTALAGEMQPYPHKLFRAAECAARKSRRESRAHWPLVDNYMDKCAGLTVSAVSPRGPTPDPETTAMLYLID